MKNILMKSCMVIKIRKAVPLANLLFPWVVFRVTLMLFVYALWALLKKMAGKWVNGEFSNNSLVWLNFPWDPFNRSYNESSTVLRFFSSDKHL